MRVFGRRSRSKLSAPAGVYSTTPSVAFELRLAILIVMSRRKQALNVAASSGVSGGVRRVFMGPAKGTLAISASAQCGAIDGELGFESRRMFEAGIQIKRLRVCTPQRKLTRIPAPTARVQIDTATTAATLQFVERMIVKSDGRLTEGPAIRRATAAPSGAPDASSISASGISKNVGNARGTETAATTSTARILAAVESNALTEII